MKPPYADTADSDIKLPLCGEILNYVKNLPEELQLTEHDWYEYHYYLKRNLFLLNKLHNLPQRVQNIYVMEHSETYISSVLSACGYRTHCHHSDRITTQEMMPYESLATNYGRYETGEYDVLLLLNILERQSEQPITFLKQTSALLKNDGKIFLTTENIASFKNRLKLLFGLSIFYTMDGDDSFNFRKFGISDLCDIFLQVNLDVQESSFISPYQPFKMESLTLRRYLLKYLSYFAMKAVPGFKDIIFIMAEKGGKKG